MSDEKSVAKGVKEDVKQQAKTQAKAFGKQIKQLVKNLSPEQRDLLLRRLTEEHSPDVVTRAHGGEVPLSFAQEREWFRDRLFPDVAHNISGALRLEGALSLDALQATFDAVMARHEVLRSNIRDVNGQPVQTVAPPSPVPIRIIERTDWRTLYAEEAVRGFDLANDPLLRVTLIRLAEREHILLITMHHIAADGWSIGVLMREVAELYASFVERRPAALPELKIQYGDFARWQRQRNLDNGLSYWRHQLAAAPPALELPPDVAPTGREHDAGSIVSEINASLKKSIEAVSRGNDTTLFVTLLTAFVVLLMRRTGRDDIIVGSPVSGRSRVEAEPLIGLFLNTLALRVRLSPQLTFREALAIVRQTVLEALDHAEVPVERVVQDLDIRRRSDLHPLYETIFNFTPSAPRRLQLPNLQVTLEDALALIEEFSTQLFITEFDGSLSLDLRYRSNRYSRELMAGFVEQYLRVLQQVAADPGRPLGSLDLTTALSPDPRKPMEMPRYKTVIECIDDWVARTPDASAIASGDAIVTYAEFGASITTVADSLRKHGMQAGDVVAVFGSRSPLLIVSMTAVFAAGGVLLTLAPDLPEKRRQVMLDQAGARFLIHDGDITPIDGGSSVTRADAAYVFFTSGSSGTPKAVVGTHQGLAHWLQWQRDTFEVGPGDRSGQLTGLSFDVVLRDIFLPLTAGATLVLPDDDDTLRWLDREGITTIHTVPAVAESWLLRKPDGVTLRSLRRIFFAGEPLTSVLVNRWREAFPQSGGIINLYGPTETTLAKCFYRVPPTPRPGIQPLGHALPLTQVLVLTSERALCGIGEPGEIAIRTAFRSAGYLNAPEENERRFIRNPFTDDEDDILYLTGDRGVIGAGGLIEFRGRIDQQVKIRGVRVEPMEVAAALQAHDDVAACAVITRPAVAEAESGDEMLVAYVVLKDDAAENSGALQEFLAQRLPAAMVPTAFVFLDALPLTSNQKLDRDKLPPPSGIRPALESRYVAPRDAIELRLVQIWEELLRVRPIGVTDRFFEVGGHSLLALRLLVEVEQRLGRKVPLQALFEEPTIEHMAAVLRRNGDDWPLLVTLRPGDQRLKLFLVHPGGGTLLNYVHLIRHLPAEIPVNGIQARGLDGNSEPHDTLEQMAADYIAEIRRAQAEGPYLLAGHSLGGVIAFEIARQLHKQKERVAFLGLFDSVAPLSHGEQTASDEHREDALRLATMSETIGRFLGEGVDVSYEALCNLTSDEQIEYVINALRRTRALPPGEEQKLIRNLLKVSKAHIRAHRAYQAEKIPVPITLYRVGDAQQSDYPAANAELLGRDSLGWDSLTTSPVRIVRAAGNHVTMLNSAHAAGLAHLLEPSLAEAIANEGTAHV
jgi:amino acid adenylation domain-containing protein